MESSRFYETSAILWPFGNSDNQQSHVLWVSDNRYGEGWTDYFLLGGLAIAWGVGDATFNTQISALLGILYPHDTVRFPPHSTKS